MTKSELRSTIFKTLENFIFSLLLVKVESHTLGQHPEILLQHQQLPILRGGLQHICPFFIALWVDKLLLLLRPEKIIHIYHAAFERKCRTAVPVLFFHFSLGLFDHLRKLRLFAALREWNIDISEYNLTLT